MAHQTYQLRLLWSKNITPSVKHLAFVREDGIKPQYQPGQFITLHIPTSTGKIAHRSYSVANPPNDEGILEVSAAYVQGGLATQLLFNLKEGESVTALGPIGLFVLKEEQPKRYVMVATGTGVTPYRAMLPILKARLEAQPELTIEILLGVRKKEDLLFAEEFLTFAKEQPRFRFHAFFSRETNSLALAPHEQVGRVQAKFEALKLNPSQDLIYLCGNPGMIDDAFKALTEQFGFDKKSVRREKYSFAH